MLRKFFPSMLLTRNRNGSLVKLEINVTCAVTRVISATSENTSGINP